MIYLNRHFVSQCLLVLREFETFVNQSLGYLVLILNTSSATVDISLKKLLIMSIPKLLNVLTIFG